MIWRPISGRLRQFALCLVLALAVAACGGKKEFGTRPGIVPLESQGLPPGELQAAVPVTDSIHIAPYDKLAIDVYGIEGMQEREVIVDPSGTISFPLVGELRVAGMTQGEIALLMRAALQEKYIRDPQVSVNLVESNALGTFTVSGAVNQSGTFAIKERTTLLKAIAAARGTNQDADSKSVLIFRTVDGVDYVALYDLRAVRRGNYADPQIYPGDVVVVDEAAARQLFRDLSPLLSGPLIAILSRI